MARSKKQPSVKKHETTLGSMLVGGEKRDAIHIAVAPVVACQNNLLPGTKIGFVKEGDFELVGSVDDPIGIVDPFLTEMPVKGDRFYMLLFPNTITSLRHEWTHPAFAQEEVDQDSQEKEMAIQWLTMYAKEVDLTYDELIQAGKECIRTDDYVSLDYDTPDIVYKKRKEFWKHFEKVTGMKHHDEEKTFFSCAC